MEKISPKFNAAWKAASVLSFLLYYSGAVFFYGFMRKVLLKKYHRIILTYHRVHNGPDDPEMTVTSAHFREQIAFLYSHFRIVPLKEILFMKHNSTSQDLVSITFDDGYEDNFIYAFPILKDKSAPATIFLVANKVGQAEKMLTAEQIRVMQQSGISFGSHTCTHPILAEIPLEEAEREIALSKEILESFLQQKVDFFAYPKGKAHQYGPAVKKLVQEYGYKAALTMENGVLTEEMDLFEVKRLGVRDIPLFFFKTRISGLFESFPFVILRKALGAR